MASSGIKSLAKDTAIYGVSSIVGRFLNWCLVPIHVYVFTDPIEYGKVGQLYGFIALFMVLLTYGMETGFFRFMNKDEEKPATVYSTSLLALGFTSLVFIIGCSIFINPISELMRYPNHHDHILMMVLVVALDAFMTIPFAKLRYDKRPIRFATIRLAFIFSNIFFNLFFLLLCPWLYKSNPELISWFYAPEYGIGYIFLANLLSTIISLIMLVPNMLVKINFDFSLLRRMLKYSYPLLILGIAGIVSHAVVPLTYPYIFDTPQESQTNIGIYTACIKITLVIAMFTQAFRYAYEPFVFAKGKGKDDTKTYSDAMKYFIIFALLLFIAVIYYMDIIKNFVSPNYFVGLSIVPIAMLGEICFGIYFNLSIWYKLTDKTQYGATLSIAGCVISLAINIALVPVFGFIASAWAILISNFMIMTISYLLGRKHYPINYNLKNILFYCLITIGFYLVGTLVEIDNLYLRLAYRTILLVAFVAIIVKRDIPLTEIPFIKKYIKSNK